MTKNKVETLKWISIISLLLFLLFSALPLFKSNMHNIFLIIGIIAIAPYPMLKKNVEKTKIKTIDIVAAVSFIILALSFIISGFLT